MRAGAEEAKREHWIPLEMELQAVVSYLTWALGSNLRSLGRAAASTLNLRTISPSLSPVLIVWMGDGE